MKNWIRKGVATLLAAFMLIGQAVSASAAGIQKESLKIASLSDTHYLSPDLIKDTADFTEHLNSDRKMFAESDAFITALLDTIKQDNPDVLLISGDLTKDGEKEGHEDLSEKLEKFRDEEMPDLHIYITPGNHDLNNSNAMNFNTESGEAEPAGRTTQEDYKEIYDDLTYNDETVINTFEPAQGKQAGGLSYVARPKAGFTIISIDSARYSADNTDSGKDEHETSGAISADLEKWIVEQITAAKQRGDTVIGLQHHGMIPHFSMEPDLLPMYLINDYERLSQVYADAGMQYIFTGHMHANDIATITTEKGNTLYDIETGSVVTYPSPARSVTITRTIENGTVKENMDVKTYTGVGPITFTNPKTGEEQTIEDISAYGREHGFSKDMLTTTVNGFLHPYYAQIIENGGSKKAIETLINDLLGDSLPLDNMTLEQLVDVALPLLLPGSDSSEEIYYDSNEGGIVINKKVSIVTLNVVIPNTALKETFNVLLQKLDNEVLADPAKLDAVIEGLIGELISIPVSMDGETQKNLLDYANYIYQSHLGGEDSIEQPTWVTEATAKIESGELLETVLVTVISNISNVANQLLENLSLEELVGASAWDNNTKEFIALEGRTPLIRPYDENAGNTLSVAFAFILKWPADDNGIISIPEGSNPEVGYSVADFLDGLSSVVDLDINQLLNDLLIGTEEEPGLIDAELKGQINTWLLNIVNSMGTDSNYPQDNNTIITYEWKLLTDRTELDEAIAQAEKIDLIQYTDETAKAVTDALNTAKDISLTATQEEIDEVTNALNDAVKALVKKTDNSGNTNIETPDNDNTQNPDNENTNKPGNAPQTGDNVNLLLIFIIMLSSMAVVLFLFCFYKKKANNH